MTDPTPHHDATTEAPAPSGGPAAPGAPAAPPAGPELPGQVTGPELRQRARMPQPAAHPRDTRSVREHLERQLHEVAGYQAQEVLRHLATTEEPFGTGTRAVLLSIAVSANLDPADRARALGMDAQAVNMIMGQLYRLGLIHLVGDVYRVAERLAP